jgi:hypothetical protein
MKTLFTAISVSLLVTLSGCGSQDTSAKLKHVPTKGVKTCDTEVNVPGDPHARVNATRVVFYEDMKKADVMEFTTRAMNLGTGQEIFGEIYRESLQTFELKLNANQVLELFSVETQKVVGAIQSVSGTSNQMILKWNKYSTTLTCRQVQN